MRGKRRNKKRSRTHARAKSRKPFSSRLTPDASRLPSAPSRFLFNRAAIIGVGLIGGSLGLALRRRRLVREVIGSDHNGPTLERAVRRGAIDRSLARAVDAVKEADLVVLATPVGSLPSLVKECAGSLAPGSIVTDVGSVKGSLVGQIDSLLPSHVTFISAHPLSGGEQSGIDAASPDLFAGSRCLLTPGKITDANALEKLSALWQGVGATVSTIDPYDHDRYLAVVSHLPHLVAYALVNCALEAEQRYPGLLGFSAGGFRDFTRIAASSPDMWRDICLENQTAILEAVAQYQTTLERLRRLVESADGAALEQEFSRARQVKMRLRSS